MKRFSLFTLVLSAFTLAACSTNSTTTSSAQNANGAADNASSVQQLNQQVLKERYNTVYFGFNQYDILPQYAQLLDQHAALLIANPQLKVNAGGHTDERGTPEYNIALGQRRVDAVANYLTQKGVNPEQISTVSYGEEKPAVLGHDEAVYSKNRRAELSY